VGFGHVLFSPADQESAAVSPASEPTYSPEDSKLNEGEDGVDRHGGHQGISDDEEPLLIEVAHGAFHVEDGLFV